MDSAITLVLFALLSAFVGDAAASCRQVANNDMLEYLCEGGHPADLTGIPANTEKLQIIKMPLRRITADTFSRFNGNLLVLSCSHCEIADIDADAFRPLVNLQQLSLDNGRLTAVKAAWFESLSQLTYLDLTYNDISEIEDDVYRYLPSLVDFRISGNRLRCLNLPEMSHLRDLKRIFLSENAEFACPHAVSQFLENQGVKFEPDPEWRRLASDTIDVHVPPPPAEEDRGTTPTYSERLHPDRRPPPEQPEAPHGTDRGYYQRPRHRKPTPRPTTTAKPVPRVEQLPPEDTRGSQELPPESPSQWAKEAAEAERLEKMLKMENEENAAANDLALVIQNRNKARGSQADSFFDSLIDKYAKKTEKPTRKKTSLAETTKKTKKKA